MLYSQYVHDKTDVTLGLISLKIFSGGGGAASDQVGSCFRSG